MLLKNTDMRRARRGHIKIICNSVAFWYNARLMSSQERSLKNKGIEPTGHRTLVLKALQGSATVTTASDLLKSVRKKSSMDKVTLYRILDLFVSKNLARRLTLLNGTMAFEFIGKEEEPHPHFLCRVCGTIRCLGDMDVSGIKRQLSRTNKLNPDEIELKIEGVCSQCQT